MTNRSTTADLLLYGGRVLTFDGRRSCPEAIALSAGRILAVGTEQEVRPYVGKDTVFVPCHGNTVLPGFVDPHLHLYASASRRCGADLSTTSSICKIQDTLRAEQSRVSAGYWLKGYGYDEFFLMENRHPTRNDLDQVSDRIPIILRHRTGHAAVLNSPGLRLAGIGKNSTPLASGTVERDISGNATGVLYEAEKFLHDIVPASSEDSFHTALKKVSDDLVRLGVCSFHDATASNTPEHVQQFAALRSSGILKPHPTVMVGFDSFSNTSETDWKQLVQDAPKCLSRHGSIKILLHESGGDLVPSPEDLAEMVWQIHKVGFQAAIHAVEEAPVCVALAAIQNAQNRTYRADHRHRIEHATLCPPSLLQSFVESGTAVVVQPAFLYAYGEKYLTEVEPDVHGWLYRTLSFQKKGVAVIGSSDYPVGPSNPFLGIQAAATRKCGNGSTLNSPERMSLTESIKLFTCAGAWVGFDEQSLGKIIPGYRADIIIADGDIFDRPVESLGATPILTTIIDGQIVYSA